MLPSLVYRTVFVASDNDHMLSSLSKHFRRGPSDVLFVASPFSNDPHLDLAVLGRADHFVGNCVSSFSAFVKRERDVRGLPTTFWGFPSREARRKEQGNAHDPGEL